MAISETMVLAER